MSLLTAPAVLIRWRLSKRLAPFGAKPGAGWIFPAVLTLILLWSLAAYPVLVRTGPTDTALLALASVPALWLVIVLLKALVVLVKRAPTRRLLRASTVCALLPAYGIAVICLCLILPLLLASEKHWLKQDTLFHIDPAAADLGAYEYKVAAQKRKELNTILGFR